MKVTLSKILFNLSVEHYADTRMMFTGGQTETEGESNESRDGLEKEMVD